VGDRPLHCARSSRVLLRSHRGRTVRRLRSASAGPGGPGRWRGCYPRSSRSSIAARSRRAAFGAGTATN